MNSQAPPIVKFCLQQYCNDREAPYSKGYVKKITLKICQAVFDFVQRNCQKVPCFCLGTGVY